MMAWSPTATSAMVGVTVAAFAPMLVGWWALRHPRPPGGTDEAHAPRRIIGEAMTSSQALLGFFALANADVIVARQALDPHAAGLYAGGLILSKAVLFLPQFVVVLTFPALATADERRHALTRALAVVAGLGALCSLGAWLMPEVALRFVGGDNYRDIAAQLWLFAVLGTVLAMLQLLIYALLARSRRGPLLLTWVALAALVVVGPLAGTALALLLVVLGIEAALLVALVTATLRRGSRVASDPSVVLSNG
jgi:O-antigen/teichoic acid export membrane protein